MNPFSTRISTRKAPTNYLQIYKTRRESGSVRQRRLGIPFNTVYCEMAENLTSQRVTREEFFVPIGETWVAQFFNDTTTSGPKCCMQLKQLELKMLPKTSPSFQ